MILVYETDEGLGVVTPSPSSSITPADLASRVVPDGAAWAAIDPADLPVDGTGPEAWRLDAADPSNPKVVVDPAKKAAIDLDAALQANDRWFAETLEEGFTTAGGWTLGLQQQDVALLTGNFVLAKESVALGGPIPPVIDRDGVPHEMEDLAELTAIMLAYGQRRAEISAEYAARKAAIMGG